MLFKQGLTRAVVNLLMVIGLIFICAVPAFAQESVSGLEDPFKPLAEDSSGESEVILDNEEEIAAVLSEFGYSQEQIETIFKMSYQIGEAYQNGANEEELLKLSSQFDAIENPANPSQSFLAESEARCQIFSFKWLLSICGAGGFARYTTKFGPYVSTHLYVTLIKGEIKVKLHTKGGFCFRLFRRCSITHNATEPGLYIAHIAAAVCIADHTVGCR